jgi:hydroxymethylpyrimidine/phosphomethylpyrimidine kinase
MRVCPYFILKRRIHLELKRVLTVAGSDPSGGAGIQADLKTISALGAYGMSVITALTAQNTYGVQDIYEIPPEFVEKQFDSVAGDIGIDALKTGMLVKGSIVAVVSNKIKEFNIKKVVVDPVLAATDGISLLSIEARVILVRDLLPLALVATPNIPEAEVLSGIRIASRNDMENAAKAIFSCGAKSVLIKGGHLEGPAVDLFYDGHNFHAFSCERINTRSTHGTGCTLASAIATGLAQNLSVLEAIDRAKQYVTLAIRHSLALGRGRGPVNHLVSFTGCSF